jgi:phosphatidylglycerol:prolipoprotein diacylglycerol transferase
MKKNLLIILSIIISLLLLFFVFIPVFQGKLEINPVITLGPIAFRWYGVILALSILAAFFWARKNSWRFGISHEAIDDYSFWVVLVGVLGARVYYVLFNYNYFFNNLSEIYKIWHGGLSIYGAILFGLLFTYFYTRRKAYTFYQLFDLIALSLPLAQAIGRFGNFVNQEAYGSITNLPWKMYVSVDHQFHHPAFLYEAILDLSIFFVLQRLMGKTRSGVIGWTYLALYSLGRFFIEGIRVDSFFVNGFRVDQIMAILLVLISGLMILRMQKS